MRFCPCFGNRLAPDGCGGFCLTFVHELDQGRHRRVCGRAQPDKRFDGHDLSFLVVMGTETVRSAVTASSPSAVPGAIERANPR